MNILIKNYYTYCVGMRKKICKVVRKCCASDYLDELIETANMYKLTPNVLSILISNEYGKDNENISKRFDCFKKENLDAIKRQIQTIESIEDILQREKVIWIKGLPLSTILYDDCCFRRSGDIDFLVKPTRQREFVKLLESKGFKKVGIINEELGVRYSVHFHEIQLMSPYNVLIEIKKVSAEMDTFKSQDMISDFWNHTEEINVLGHKFNTLDLTHTLVHLFLAAFSNSTVWHKVESNGIRELYEIVLFCQKYKIDYNRLLLVANLYGMCSVIRETMKKINGIFGKVFSNSVLELFESTNSGQHMLDKLYTAFLKYYNIGYFEELFDKSKKTEAYFEGVYKAYYLENIYFTENFLCPDILEYKLWYQIDKLKLDFCIHPEYFYSDKESVFELKFLCNNEDIIDKFGYKFVFWVVLKGGTVEGVLKNVPEIQGKQKYKVISEAEIIEQVNNKMHFTYYIPLFFLKKNSKKICYNAQLMIHNENDGSQFFARTILCPQKDTLPIYHTEYLNNMKE